MIGLRLRELTGKYKTEHFSEGLIHYGKIQLEIIFYSLI